MTSNCLRVGAGAITSSDIARRLIGVIAPTAPTAPTARPRRRRRRRRGQCATAGAGAAPARDKQSAFSFSTLFRYSETVQCGI